MDWDKLKIFHTVAEASSFTKASTILNLSQSAISRQIQGLEGDLKVQLFERHARGLVLTENGEYLFKSASKPCIWRLIADWLKFKIVDALVKLDASATV